MDIPGNLYRIKNQLPQTVSLVAVSKTQSPANILKAYAAGQRLFGENKAQEMVSKYHSLPKDIQWHFIGHLQTNKVKQIISLVSMIHSVDSLSLAGVINKEAKKANRIVDCLLQVHIANEESKFGFDLNELESIIMKGGLDVFKNIRFRGVMGMATFTEDDSRIRSEFSRLNSFFRQIKKKKYLSGSDDFTEISMGMSDDYLIAIEEGSTIVRIGSSIFGPRIYV
jgi:PLP dependent protein